MPPRWPSCRSAPPLKCQNAAPGQFNRRERTVFGLGWHSGSQAEEEQEQELLHAPVVQSLARMLHLNLDTTIFLLLAINFAIIFFAIAIPLGKLMPKIIRKRSQTLSQDLQTARAATADAQSRLSAVEAKLAGLDEEMEKFRAQVEQDSLEDEKRIKAALGEESARIVAAAEQEINVAAAQARRGLRNFAAELAIDQASKQLALTPETDRALIAEFVAGVTADGSGKGGRELDACICCPIRRSIRRRRDRCQTGHRRHRPPILRLSRHLGGQPGAAHVLRQSGQSRRRRRSPSSTSSTPSSACKRSCATCSPCSSITIASATSSKWRQLIAAFCSGSWEFAPPKSLPRAS